MGRGFKKHSTSNRPTLLDAICIWHLIFVQHPTFTITHTNLQFWKFRAVFNDYGTAPISTSTRICELFFFVF